MRCRGSANGFLSKARLQNLKTKTIFGYSRLIRNPAFRAIISRGGAWTSAAPRSGRIGSGARRIHSMSACHPLTTQRLGRFDGTRQAAENAGAPSERSVSIPPQHAVLAVVDEADAGGFEGFLDEAEGAGVRAGLAGLEVLDCRRADVRARGQLLLVPSQERAGGFGLLRPDHARSVSPCVCNDHRTPQRF